jgi:hypothetical protein
MGGLLEAFIDGRLDDVPIYHPSAHGGRGQATRGPARISMIGRATRPVSGRIPLTIL